MDISKIPESELTQEMCYKAVAHDAFMIKYVPDKFKTAEVCLEPLLYVDYYHKIREYLPVKFNRVEKCITYIESRNFVYNSDTISGVMGLNTPSSNPSGTYVRQHTYKLVSGLHFIAKYFIQELDQTHSRIMELVKKDPTIINPNGKLTDEGYKLVFGDYQPLNEQLFSVMNTTELLCCVKNAVHIFYGRNECDDVRIWGMLKNAYENWKGSPSIMIQVCANLGFYKTDESFSNVQYSYFGRNINTCIRILENNAKLD